MKQFVEELLEALRSERLQVTEVQPDECWSVPFDIDGTQYATLVFNGRGTNYFLIMCPVIGLPWTSINDATIEELRRIIRMQSTIRLARLEYHEGENLGLFIAVSECSTENFTGLKLRRRMEACAQLAARMRAEFPRTKSG